ncbi:hypothetical protein FRC18_010178 [Serendipita sp. 400]|nr:hypothetical protein FRC18_010178 [Serendipita sp. 400]
MASDGSKHSGPFSFLRRKPDERKIKSKSTRPSKKEANYPKDSTVLSKDSPLTAGVEPPSAGTYAFEAGKQTIEVLQRFSNALPIPCANEVLEVALHLMTTYEDVTKVEEQVKDINNRIGCLMLVMVDGLNGKDAASLSPQVIRDIEQLGIDLRAIQKDLARITSQSRWLLIFFKDANKEIISACLDRLSDALQSFQVTRAISDGNMLFNIQARLESMNKVTGKMATQVNEVYNWLKDKNAHSGQSNLVLQEMPIPIHLYGRNAVVSQIARILTTKPRPRVGILGAGGMGKTSVAVAVMEHELVGTKYQEDHRFWVPCVGITSPIMFLQILSKSLRVSQDTGALLKDILYTLKSTQEPRLVLLDNLETALSSPEVVSDGGRLSAEEIIDQLAIIPHVSILATIRSNTLPSDTIAWELIPLEGVAREDARAIFTSICPKASGHPSLDALLEALGYMPYAVTLMAKHAVKSFVEPGELLAEWKKSGTKSLSTDLRLKMDRSIELSVESKAMVDNPNAQQLLAILSKLPSGTNQKHLKWWAKTVDHISSAIATLNDTALITQRQEGVLSPTFFVLPVVQSYLHENSRYNSPEVNHLVIEACCRFVLDHKSSPDDKEFKAHIQELDIEKTNIQAIFLGVTANSLPELGLAQNASYVFEAMLTFSWYQAWTRGNPELLNHLLEILSSLNTEDETTLRHIAEAHFCLGKTYQELGRHTDACTAIDRARTEFSKLGTPADIVRRGHAVLCLAEAWSFLQLPSKSIEDIVIEAQEDLKSDPKGSACALVSRGFNYWYGENPEVGLKTLEDAKKSLEELGCTAEVVRCMLYMMRCNASLGFLSERLRIAQEALLLAKSIGTDNFASEALWNLSCCHIRMGQYDEALVILKESLLTAERVGSPLTIAQVLELSGYAYGMKRDLLGGRLGYEEAKKAYSEMGPLAYITEGLDRCRYNLWQIEIAEGGHVVVEDGHIELRVPMLD